VVHELHERSSNQLSHSATRQQEIDDCHDGQQADEADDDDYLGREAATTPARDAFVPDG